MAAAGIGRRKVEERIEGSRSGGNTRQDGEENAGRALFEATAARGGMAEAGRGPWSPMTT
jgi:hypothetical protein